MSTTLWRRRPAAFSPTAGSHRRSREVIFPTGGIFRSKFPSAKNGRVIHTEGLLELDAAYLLEVHPNVIFFGEQAKAVAYPQGDRCRRYRADFVITLRSGQVLLAEIKPERSLEDAETLARLKAIREHLRQRGQRYLVLTDKMLRQEPRLPNARLICLRAGRHLPSPERARTALDRLAGQFPMQLAAAERTFAGLGLNTYGLLIRGDLRCDLDLPLTADALIHINSENDDELLFLAEERLL